MTTMNNGKRLAWSAFAIVVAAGSTFVASPAMAATPAPAPAERPARKQTSKAAPKKPRRLKNASPHPEPPAPAAEEPAPALEAPRPPSPPPARSEAAEPPAMVAVDSPKLTGGERDTSASSAAPPAARPIGRETITLEARGGAGTRHFSYRDSLTERLRGYDLAAAPVLSLSGELYPFPMHGLVDVGVTGDYMTAIGVSSAGLTDRVSTSWSRFRVGPRARFRVGATDPTVFGASVSYGGESFGFGPTDPSQSQALPEVDYRFVRPSIDVRVPFDRASIFGEIAYSAILSAGKVADRFPHASVGGVDAGLGVGYRLVSHVELRAALAYRRYFYALKPEPGDAFVAGGALDWMGTGELGLAGFF